MSAEAGITQIRSAIFDALADLDSDSAALDLPNEPEKIGLVRLSTGEVWIVTIQQANLVVIP